MSYYTIRKNDIANLYSDLRLKALQDLDARRRKIYADVPGIEQLEDEISQLNTDTLRRIATAAPEDTPRLRQERKDRMTQLNRKKEELLSAHGYSPEDLTIRYACPLCQDTGVVDGVRCSCYKKHQLSLLYRQSSLADVLSRENFSTFSLDYYSRDPRDASENTAGTPSTEGNDPQAEKLRPSPYDNMVEILARAKAFTGEFEAGAHPSILFYGETGLGKTFLSHCIAKEMLDHNHSVLYVTANELFQQILSPYLMNSDEDSRERLQPVFDLVYQCDLLVLDDLGTELTNSFTVSQLFEIVNRRLLDRRSTIISTNYSLQHLQTKYEDRILSRIVEGYQLLRVYGKNVRTLKKLAQLNEGKS